MTTSKQLTAKVLEVACEELVQGESSSPRYTFKAIEFWNGLILVQSDTTNDWFFGSRDEIDACGNAQVTGVVETGETEEWTSEEVLRSIQGSIREFGEDSVPTKHHELWR